MKKFILILCFFTVITTSIQYASAAGISIDAGLTPPEDRWIVRNQFRFMQREDDPTSMDREVEKYVFPFVVAYGFKPELTFMARQKFINKNMSMGGSTSRDSGLDDLFLLAKYKLFRRNTRDYTFGMASTIGLELPTGEDEFSSETWDLEPGLFASWRSGPWASDFRAAYKWNGFADKGKNGLDPGDKFSVDLAFAHQFSINGNPDISIAPVLEFNYEHFLSDRLDGDAVPNTGESVLFISPGIKFTKSSFILEALVQFPVLQDQKGLQTELGTRFIVGTRVLF